MGRASRRKWENRFTELKAKLVAVEKKSAPWWESNLLWGGVLGLILAVVVSAMKDLRWLLGFAWVFSLPIAWSIAKNISSSIRRCSCFFLIIVIAGSLLYWLNVTLRPNDERFPTVREIADEVSKRLPKQKEIAKYPSPKPETKILSDPVLHLEPEHKLIWSTAANETVGVFVLSLHNTGLEDVDNTTVTQDYFVAQRGAQVIIKNLGGTPVANPMPSLLKRKSSVPVRIDFTQHIRIMNEVSAHFKGASIRGVRITIRFRRHIDGKDFVITRGYAVIGTNGEGIYPEGHEIDRKMVGSELTLGDVTPFFELPGHWRPVTKAISWSPDGRQVIKYY